MSTGPMRIRAAGLRRREAVAIGLALAATLTVWSAAHAADLTGTGELIVPDAGGATGEALRAAYYEPFEAATGITVVESPGAFDNGVIMAGVKAGAPAYDIVNINGASVFQFIAEGALLPIDYTLWEPGERESIGPVAATDYAVPAYYIMMQPAWSTDLLPDAAIASWADFWDTARFPGKRALAPGAWGSGSGTFEAALLADGVAPADLYPLDLDRAFASLDKLRPDILKFWETGAEPLQLLATGQAALASAWNGRIYNAGAEGAPVASAWNQGILQYDAWVVLKGAPNQENAMKFMAWMAQAEPQAEFARRITYSPANLKAYDLLDPERVALLPTAPDHQAGAVVQDYEWWAAKAPGSDRTNEELAIERWQEWVQQ